MGLKSGSRDAGLDDEEEEVEEETSQSESTESEDVPETSDASMTEESSATTSTQTESQRPTMQSIPYKLRRDRVNEGREQVPFFLREDVIDAEDELQNSLEAMLGEDVYKSDYREAAMIVAQRNPELVAEVLREWGYDLDAV
jgi:cell envelope opacity-associated protein A